MDRQRLDKLLSSQLPSVSRSDARNLIRRGEVAVNGEIVRSPDYKADPLSDRITLRGDDVGYRKNIYIMLNKPAGVVCATRDGISETVLELLPEHLRRKGLFPAGRLDRDTVGFVLITDDGPLAHRLLSPKSHVAKTYFVRLKDDISEDAEKIFSDGMEIDGGETCLPAELKRLNRRECELTLHEGKYHQIKRMFSALGNEVVYLKRIRFADIELDPGLLEGQARELGEDEISALKSR